MTTTAPALELKVSHRAGCHRPPLQASPELGGVRQRCPGCGKHVFIKGATATTQPQQGTVSGYTCREHYLPVNWRGKGCKQCDNAFRTRRAARTAARQGNAQEYDPWALPATPDRRQRAVA